MLCPPKRIRRASPIAAALVALALLAHSKRADACSATQTQVYQSATTVWCVEKSVITQFGAFPTEFFPYGDNVIKELVALFKVPAQGVYTFEASVPNGGAHTGSECCGLGVTVTGDAFYNNAYNVKGFWGYLLSLHETINDWTGQVSSGWPTDFWADHISAFPNSMDWHVMGTLGALDHDNNLVTAAAAQKARFYPGGDSADPRVGMFDQIFALPNIDYAGLSRVFGYVEADKLNWDNLGVPNPNVKRSEYVAAYLSLGPGQSVLPILKSAGVCNGQPDGQNDPTYTCSEANIDAIATAHCAIHAAAAQGSNEAADWSAFRAGDYAAVKAQGSCGAGCPSECGCKTASNRCVAPWLGDAPASDAGAHDGGGAADSGAAGDASAGAADGGGVGSGDASVTGGDDAGSGNGANAGDGPSDGSGCSCRAAGRGVAFPALAFAGAIGMLRIGRRRARARKR